MGTGEQEQLWGDYYREIYAKGMLAGEKPTLPMAWAELERRAAEALDERAVAYVYGGAGSEDTMRANLEAFRRWRIVPRVLSRDLSSRNLATELLGTAMPAPLLLAPIGVQTLVHPDGELASARAAGELGLPLIASTASATPMEEIAEANGEEPRWYQLYWTNEEELTASLVRRAERSGYRAIVVTVDNFMPGWKPRDLQQAYLPFLEGIGIAQYLSDPVFREGLEKPPEEDMGAAVGRFISVFSNATLTWDDLEWLRDGTPCRSCSRGSFIPMTPDWRASAVPRGSSSPITAAARSTERSPRSRRCPRSSRRSATRSRCCSTAAFAPAPTPSRRWRSVPTRCWSAAPICGDWRSTARPAWRRCSAACWPSSI
jgi:FMN-dependent dehydrogenase